MQLEEVLENVKTVIDNSIGFPAKDIELEQTLFDELGIDSIDLVDILFELEHLYGIELKISDIESQARERLGDQPYEIDGVITPEGLKVISEFMTEVNPEKFVEGLTVHQLVQLFTVHSLCKIVLYRIDEEANKT
ncbi:MAG: hypothetical protein BM555_00035 [Crocinitomix sp. MedPE-SWsnd]|nr:MAG: hypothetical protein BM555_00035 [Crocinitomix sp. MedPE-SWsnd]